MLEPYRRERMNHQCSDAKRGVERENHTDGIPRFPASEYSTTTQKRLQLVEDIWDSIASDADVEALPLTDAERILLDERLDERDAQPAAALPWSDVRARILGKLIGLSRDR